MNWKSEEYTGWGRALRARSLVARPEKRSLLGKLSKVSPCGAIGNRRSYGDLALNSQGRQIDMTRLDRIIDFDPKSGRLRVEAGAKIGDILAVFAPQGWMPAVIPGTGFATIGGCIANDVHGKNHHKMGSFGQHVISVTLLNEGEKKQVSAQKNRTLFAATMGGLGQTGVIIEAELQLTPCAGEVVRLRETRANNLSQHVDILDKSQSSYCVSWLDLTVTGQDMGRGIVEEAEVDVADVTGRQTSPRIRVDAPKFLMSKVVVRAFNWLYFRRVPALGRERHRRLDQFFFPLDRLRDWNRLYGSLGFYQFQTVVPMGEIETLYQMVTMISTAGIASPLAVLKRMGSGRAGPMSFPMEGYTLAVDFPAGAAARALISKLEHVCGQAGGRIYFAKDSLLSPTQVDQMYPERGAWAKLVQSVDPKGHFENDLTRRLMLREPVA